MAVSTVEADAGSGGALLAVDTVSTSSYPISKLDKGVAGSADLVATGNGLPVTIEAGTAEIGKLAAGTAAIGKLAANDGVDIGDVGINAALPAGDNNIGNVDIASAIPAGSNNIGNVDVASISNGSINGPGSPTIDSYTQVAISSVTGANQSLIAAPGANKQIWIYGINFTMSTAGTVAFQDEDDTAISGTMGIADTGGMAVSPSGNFAMPLWKVATNKAFEADVVTGTINGSITYGIASV